MPERLVHTFIKKSRMDHREVKDLYALTAAGESVPVDRIAVREVSPAVVLAYYAIHPGQGPSWEGEYAPTDYGYEVVVIDE